MSRTSFPFVALCAVSLSASLSAQSTIVSPVGATASEGSGLNLFPWTANTARRYLQIHGDIGGVARNISALKFRVNAANATYTATRAIDMELYMGHGVPASSPSFTIDNNYVGVRSLVLTRTVVNFGPQGTQTAPGPNPFTANMNILVPPFAYSGVGSLVWEAVVYGVASGGSGSFGTPDADQSTVTLGTSSITGTGCIATGQRTAMAHDLTVADIGGTLLMNVTVTAGPLASPCLWAIGFANPNLPVPGLCSPLQTDLTLLLSIGSTDVGGGISTTFPAAATFSLPNATVGATLTSQVHGVDLGRSDPLKIANSDGRTFTVPRPDRTHVNLVSRIFNNAGGTGATQGIFFTSTLGYALVTEFTY